MSDFLERHPFMEPGAWPIAWLLGRLHAVKIIAVLHEANGDVEIQAHTGRWFRICAPWAAANNPVAGKFLLLFPGGQISCVDLAFLETNIVVDGMLPAPPSGERRPLFASRPASMSNQPPVQGAQGT